MIRLSLVLAFVLVAACGRLKIPPIEPDPTPKARIDDAEVGPTQPEKKEAVVVHASLAVRKQPVVVFRIENAGTVDVSLEDRLRVERETPTGWVPAFTMYDTIAATCAGLSVMPASPRACVPLATHTELQPPPWLGFTCSSQCIHTCRANAALAPGRYRFVVTVCNDPKRTFTSNAVDWPGAI